MIIGDSNKFSVKICTDREVIPSGLQPCHFSYIISDMEIGNFRFEAPEYEILLELSNIISNRSTRQNSKLFGQGKNEVVHQIRRGLVEDRGLYSNHVLTYYMGHGHPPEEGGRWEVYIVEHEEIARVLFAEQRTPEQIHEIRTIAGSVDDVLARCHSHLQARLVNPPMG